MVAQRLFECINQHVNELELELFTGDANDHTPLALITQRCSPSAKSCSRSSATSPSPPRNTHCRSRASWSGTWSGKSTTINHVIHHVWKAGEDQVAQEMQVLDEVFRAGETVLDAQDEDAEQAALNESRRA